MKEVVFTKEDYEGRLKVIREKMKEAGMVGILVSGEANLNYYSGFCTHAPWTTFTRPSFLFIPLNEEPRMLVQTFLRDEAQTISHCCKVDEFRSLLGPTPDDLANVMKAVGMDKGKVGFELGFEQRISYEVNTYEGLKKLMTNVEFCDASLMIWSQRIIKSSKEIECHRRACAATSYAHDRIFDEICEGMSEREITRRVQQLMLEGGADYAGFAIITSGPGNYGRISKTYSDRKLEKGDLVWIDLGARYNNYWSDFCRAGVVGEISDERKKYQDDVYKITMGAASIMKPGVSMEELTHECGRLMEEAGYDATYDCGRMGHGMGLNSTEPPSVALGDETILKEGMIINLEPGIINDIGVFDIEENFVITKDGYECLSTAKRELHEIKTK